MGGKPTTNQTTVQQQEAKPWGPAEPLLMDMLTRAQEAMRQTPKTPVFTGPNADQTAAIDSFRTLAGKAGQGADELRNLGTATARGDFLSPQSNPYLQGAIDAAINPLRKQLTGNVMAAGDAAQMAGAYGGDRGEILKAKALRDFNEVGTDTAARMLAQNYQFERGMQQGAGGLLTQANEVGSQPGLLLDQIGTQQQNWDMQKAIAAMDAPWAGLDRFSNILSTVTPYGTTNTNSTTTGSTSGGQGGSALKGAMGGASAGAAFGPWGAGIGAVLGGLGGLFG